MKTILGLVLCGGLSSRMGRDKGLLEREGQIWAKAAGRKLENLGLPVYYSLRPEQLEPYKIHIQEEAFLLDSPSLPYKGPLLGIMSAFLNHREYSILCLACDMTHIQDSLLRKLIGKEKENPGKSIVFRKGEDREPLCALYSQKDLSSFHDYFTMEERRSSSMMYLLDFIGPLYLEIEDREAGFFLNENSPGDWMGN